MSSILHLFNEFKNYLNQLNSPHLAPFLADWPTAPIQTRFPSPTTLPVLDHLPSLTNYTKQATTLVQTLIANTAHLHWGQTYSASDFGSAFLQQYGWTELMGLRGPFANTKLACGFLLLGPNLEYPLHSHEAEEVYVPLVNGTIWARESESWEGQPVDQPIYHPSWLRHGMRTTHTPFLALYLWRNGNLIQKSRIEKRGKVWN